uniref:Uncharacterized protein n=1 Tax=Anopheles maculatus TaxID=74869 RepID=A0A182S6G3_9DIPT
MEQTFAKRIRYNSTLYRNRDRLIKAELDDDLLPRENANAAQSVQNVDDIEQADNNLTNDTDENENTETFEIGDEADDADDFDDDDDHVVDYLIESSDDEQEVDEHNEEFSVQDALRRWAISKSQTYESIEEVMGIIRRVSNCKLPKDAKTLLEINRNPSAEILTIEEGQYWYRGVQKCFLNELR